MNADQKADMRRFLVACTGLTELSDGKVGVVLQIVKPDGTLDTTRKVFAEKACKKVSMFIGSTYQVEATEDFSTAIIAGAKYQGIWANDADRAEWKTLERAFTLERAAKKRHASDADRNAMSESLAPIREAYRKTNSVGRLAIEIQVLAYLRGQKIT
jgi:hypothetical protein